MWSEKNPLLKDLQKINESHYHYEVAESYYPQENKTRPAGTSSLPWLPHVFLYPKEKRQQEKVMRE